MMCRTEVTYSAKVREVVVAATPVVPNRKAAPPPGGVASPDEHPPQLRIPGRAFLRQCR